VIGDSSFSLYLFHPFSLGLFAIVFNRLGVDDFGAVFVTLLIVTSVIAGHVCYLVIEVPLAQLIKNNKKVAQTKSKRSINPI
jgi:exopolysaccharide production protein ExoZ